MGLTVFKTDFSMTRQELRRKLQQIRRNTPDAEQQHAATAVAEKLLSRLSGLPSTRTRVAVYKSFAGELPTQPIIEQLWQRGFQTALPVLHPFAPGHLLFLDYTPTTPMTHNKYGIEEPELNCASVVPLSRIDVLALPLVGFDHRGNRLGMGGGYYDRTLAQWHKGQQPSLHPIGLAYDAQQVERIPHEHWDIPLPDIITPSKHWRF